MALHAEMDKDRLIEALAAIEMYGWKLAGAQAVNKMLTLTKFKQQLQRTSDKRRAKTEEVAKEHGRGLSTTFSTSMCSARLEAPFIGFPGEVEKYIP